MNTTLTTETFITIDTLDDEPYAYEEAVETARELLDDARGESGVYAFCDHEGWAGRQVGTVAADARELLEQLSENLSDFRLEVNTTTVIVYDHDRPTGNVWHVGYGTEAQADRVWAAMVGGASAAQAVGAA